MMKVLKHIILLSLSISIFSLITDIEYYFDQPTRHQITQTLNDEPSGDIEENHSLHSITEELFSESNNSEVIQTAISIKIVPTISQNVTNSFITSIWQPPKFS